MRKRDSNSQDKNMDKKEDIRSATIGILKPTLGDAFDNATPDVLNDTNWKLKSGKGER
jgi:hypothetical protein